MTIGYVFTGKTGAQRKASIALGKFGHQRFLYGQTAFLFATGFAVCHLVFAIVNYLV